MIVCGRHWSQRRARPGQASQPGRAAQPQATNRAAASSKPHGVEQIPNIFGSPWIPTERPNSLGGQATTNQPLMEDGPSTGTVISVPRRDAPDLHAGDRAIRLRDATSTFRPMDTPEVLDVLGRASGFDGQVHREHGRRFGGEIRYRRESTGRSSGVPAAPRTSLAGWPYAPGMDDNPLLLMVTVRR